MGHQKFREVVGEVSPERRARIDDLKENARIEEFALGLSELRRARHVTQVELAAKLGRSQATVSAMEAGADHRLSTVRAAIEALGGELELVAVFGDERITLVDVDADEMTDA